MTNVSAQAGWADGATLPGLSAARPVPGIHSSRLFAALNDLQGLEGRDAQDPALFDTDATLDRETNLMPAVKAMLDGYLNSTAERVTLDAIGGIFEYVLVQSSLCEQMRVVFARLQIPLLKAALLDNALFF